MSNVLPNVSFILKGPVLCQQSGIYNNFLPLGKGNLFSLGQTQRWERDFSFVDGIFGEHMTRRLIHR